MKRLNPAPATATRFAPPGFPSPAQLESLAEAAGRPFGPNATTEQVARTNSPRPGDEEITAYDHYWYIGRPVRF